jgi:hypothetical protein
MASVQVNAGSMTFSGLMTNNGTLAVGAGATLAVTAASIAGKGHLNIGTAGGTLEVLSGAASTQAADFLGAAGLLQLGSPAGFAATIGGFVNGDQIDLLQTPETSFAFAGGQLTVLSGTTIEATLGFSGNLSASSFVVAGDGHGGTMITHS